jgi:hypothetical protein
VAGEEMAAAGSGKREVSALLFLAGCYIAFDAMSTVNSSPWTHETFGQDPKKAESQQWYVRQSMMASLALSGASSVIGRTPVPLFGTLVADGYLWWLYRRAYVKAKGSSS